MELYIFEDIGFVYINTDETERYLYREAAAHLRAARDTKKKVMGLCECTGRRS